MIYGYLYVKYRKQYLKPKMIQYQVKGIKPLQPYPRRKKDSENLALRIKEEIWKKYDDLDVMNLGIIKGIVLYPGRTRGKRKNTMSQMKGKNLMQRNLRKKKRKISIVIEIIFLFK